MGQAKSLVVLVGSSSKESCSERPRHATSRVGTLVISLQEQIPHDPEEISSTRRGWRLMASKDRLPIVFEEVGDAAPLALSALEQEHQKCFVVASCLNIAERVVARF